MPTTAPSTHSALPACWILDRTVVKWQRKSFTVVGIMDLRSRKALHWQVLRLVTPQAVAQVLDETIQQYGSPPALVIGVDPLFKSPALLAAYQTHQCLPLDLRQGKSSVSIFIRSLWRNLAWEGLSWSQPETEAAFRQTIDTWLKHYNQERPHQALGYKTPTAQWQQTVLASVEKSVSHQPRDEAAIIPLTIRLTGTNPLIWRRVLVCSSMTFSQLHQVIQLVMGWKNAHMHEFRVNALASGQ
ncbi:integrase core domain-containing protein (plasmid) [Fibrella sp. ES10-3-2-2]